MTYINLKKHHKAIKRRRKAWCINKSILEIWKHWRND